MDRCAIYLRKSRADLEAEARGEGETLAKHKRALMKLAREQGLNIVRIREEIVSGESLLHRPEMQELLREIEAKQYDAVLCMDMDRLGRGNMQEQGLILETFRAANTRIITPRKTYNLLDESDELMTEVESLLARQELKTITRRMQRGRVASVEEGNYIATRPPYGYDVVKDDKGRYLVPNEQAAIVKQIFQWYCENMGTSKIANQLNAMGIVSYSGSRWNPSGVLTILKNAVYIGRIQWKKKKQTKSKTPGKRRDTITRPTEEWIDVKGKHEPIIDEKMFERAQDILSTKYHVPYQLENGLTNPLAGIMKCGMCGTSMVYRPYTGQQAHLMCNNRFCENKSSRFVFVEEKLLQALEAYLEGYVIEFGTRKRKDTTNLLEVHQNAIAGLEKELAEFEKQKKNLHTLVERQVYDEETYLMRSRELAQEIANCKESIERSKLALAAQVNAQKAQQEVIPKLKNVVKLYRKAKDPGMKNDLLKSVLHHATYTKEKWQRLDQFTITLTPRFK